MASPTHSREIKAAALQLHTRLCSRLQYSLYQLGIVVTLEGVGPRHHQVHFPQLASHLIIDAASSPVTWPPCRLPPTTPCVPPQHCSNLSPHARWGSCLTGPSAWALEPLMLFAHSAQHTGQSPVGVKHRRGGVQTQSLTVEGPCFGQVPREESMVALVLQLFSLLYCLCIHWPAAKGLICLGEAY